MNHTEIYENTWEDKRDEWLPYLANGCSKFSIYICKIFNEYRLNTPVLANEKLSYHTKPRMEIL